MAKIIEKLGVYDVVEIIKKDEEYSYNRIRLKCRECGSEKIIRIGSKRHCEKTKFCRACPPEVRARVYGETWQSKNTDEDGRNKDRLMTKEELESAEQWNFLNRHWKPTTQRS